jgi:hypothetical protein
MIPLEALARLNRDARTGVLVSRDVIYRLKYKAIRAAIADGSARIERTVVQGRCNYGGHGGWEADDGRWIEECEVCGGTNKVLLGFCIVTIGDVRWHVPDHVEPGKSWSTGAPLVDGGAWKPGEREEHRPPLDVLADLVVAEAALGIDGDYDLELGVMADTGHAHDAPAHPWSYRKGRLTYKVGSCWKCSSLPYPPPQNHPTVAAWVALHPGCLDYVPPPPPPRYHSRRF